MVSGSGRESERVLELVSGLLVSHSVIHYLGARSGGPLPEGERPSRLPLWLRASIPLPVAAGLWFDQRWAWWSAVLMCGVLCLWQVVARVLLVAGGFFHGERAWRRRAYFGFLLGAMLFSLVLLLLPGKSQ